jgi:tetratricopeptide (TPR) repeat protein
MANTVRNKPGGAPVNDISSGEVAVRNIQNSFEKNQKVIVGAIVAVLILVGGYFGYTKYIQEPKEEKAANALFNAEQWFGVDSFNLALNGDGQRQGALGVIKKYSGTKAANRAEYFAGVSLLKTGKPQEAVKHLEKFDGQGTVFQYLAYGLTGDAYLEMNNTAKALEFYKKATSGNDKDNFTNPYYLFRAGFVCEKEGKIDEAKKFYQEIKSKYPRSMQARDVDKCLARLGEVSIN